MENSNDRHSISLLVNNKPGVLIRISLVFARRGYNLESLVVSAAHDPRFSRMTLVATGKRSTLEQILKQLKKLVDVIHASDHTGDDVITREMALMKLNCDASQRTEVLQLVDHFKMSTRNITDTTMIVEATGTSEKLDAVHDTFDKFGIVEYVRSGQLVIARGSHST